MTTYLKMDNNFHPLVSIVIPVYNGSNYMKEAIDSALNQTYANCEIIVVNDGSTDNTEEIALSYQDKIKYFSKDNGGQSSALNFGINQMKGSYFSWLSHDDLYYPDKINMEIKFLSNLSAEQRNKTIVFCQTEFIDGKGSLIKRPPDIIPNDTFNIRYELMMSRPINGCSLLIPKEVFESVGNFNLKRPHTSDVELFFKMGLSNTFVPLKGIYVQTRIHAGQMTYQHYKYHMKECDLNATDSLLSLTDNDKILFTRYDKHYLQTFALILSKGGYRKSYLLAIKKIESTYIQKQILYIKCLFFYIKKRIKQIIKN